MCREIYLGFIIWDIKVPIERAISLRRRCSGQGCVCGHTLIVGQVQLQSSTCHGACRPWSVAHFFAAIASTALWLSQQGKRVVTLEKFWSIFQPEFYQGPEAQDQNRDLKFGVLDPGWLTKIEISHDPEGVRSSSLNGSAHSCVTSGRLCSFSWKQIGALSNCSGVRRRSPVQTFRYPPMMP